MEAYKQWTVFLMNDADGSVYLSLNSCSNASESHEIQRGRWSDFDVLFQELLTLLDADIWSFLATRQVELGQPTLGGYAG